MKYPKADVDHARQNLARLTPGCTVYSIVRSVSRSGMSRTIDFYTFDADGPCYLTWSISRVLGYPTDKRGALKVSGCGMDMCFHVVHSLCYALWGAPKAGDAEHKGYQLRSEIL